MDSQGPANVTPPDDGGCPVSGAVSNRRVVEHFFGAWAAGDRRAFKAIDPYASWTVMGTCPGGGTFASTADFLERSARPVHDLLEQSAAPEVEEVIADGDVVVVRWKGSTRAKSGQPYDNRYCWVLRLRDSRVIEVLCYLDTQAVARLCDSSV